MNLKVAIKSKSTALETNGEIYTEDDVTTGPPVVSDVIAANGKESYFSLDPGKYIYAFAILDGMGTVTVSVVNVANGRTLSTDSFDTKDGYFGNDLGFEVK